MIAHSDKIDPTPVSVLHGPQLFLDPEVPPPSQLCLQLGALLWASVPSSLDQNPTEGYFYLTRRRIV